MRLLSISLSYCPVRPAKRTNWAPSVRPISNASVRTLYCCWKPKAAVPSERKIAKLGSRPQRTDRMVKQYLPYLLPLVVVALVGFRMSRSMKGRRIKPWQLWIRPALIGVILGFSLVASAMPSPVGLAIFAAALVVGLGLGYVLASHQTLDPRSGFGRDHQQDLALRDNSLFRRLCGALRLQYDDARPGRPPTSWRPTARRSCSIRMWRCCSCLPWSAPKLGKYGVGPGPWWPSTPPRRPPNRPRNSRLLPSGVSYRFRRLPEFRQG